MFERSRYEKGIVYGEVADGDFRQYIQESIWRHDDYKFYITKNSEGKFLEYTNLKPGAECWRYKFTDTGRESDPAVDKYYDNLFRRY